MTADLGRETPVRWAVAAYSAGKARWVCALWGTNRRGDMAAVAATVAAGEVLVELAPEVDGYPPSLLFDPETQTFSNP